MENSRTASDRPTLEEMFGEAERTLRKTLDALTDWGEQTRHLMEDRPAAALASLAIAGFMAGVLLRRDRLGTRESSFRPSPKSGLAADPMTLFLTGAITGFTLGPRLLREAARKSDRPEPQPLRRHDLEPSTPADIQDFNRR